MKVNPFMVALSDMCKVGAAAFRPPKRVSVSKGAAENMLIKRPGDAPTPWSLEKTPYMAEPMDMLASRLHAGLVFVGPAQSGKTLGLGEGWMSHVSINDPGDMLIVQMTEAKAREYSRQRIDRVIRNSPALSAIMSSSGFDNLHDKMFIHGMWLKIAWPTVTNLSSTSYRYAFLTDYDRMPQDIDGEGSAWLMALARVRTYMSRGMACVESSPGFPLKDPHWKPSTAHEAPPCDGVLGIYNGSDRRRWYWKCPDCRSRFEAKPGLELFNLPEESRLIETIRSESIESLVQKYNKVVCPHCGSMIEFRHRHFMNQRGIWVPDGVTLNEDDEPSGQPLGSNILGYWLGGVAAGYQTWDAMLMKHFQALRKYALTGDETDLMTAINTDQGMPYMPRILADAAKMSQDPKTRVDHSLLKYVVPDQARFLVAAVDVQGGVGARFIVQVNAIGPNMEQWPIDRYEIKEWHRNGPDADPSPIDPASRPEDWDAITDKVLRSTYRTSVDGREVRIKLVVVDTGGEDGVTENSYRWFRRVRFEGESHRVMLIKGSSNLKAPLLKEAMVGNADKSVEPDIPLTHLNTNMLKDALFNGFRRANPGPGYIHLPGWLPDSWFDEMAAEVRNAKGEWVQVRKRNESIDLGVYIRAGCLKLGVDKLRDWLNVPSWAKPVLEDNSEVVTKEERQKLQANERIARPSSDQVVRRGRMYAKSAYLSR